MDDRDDTNFAPASPLPPITDAYLHRDVHPNDVAGTKAEHNGPKEFGNTVFPKGDIDDDFHPDYWWCT